MANLKISEHFHSIQGEGRTAGKQAVFLRLQSCNLMCGGNGTEKDQELHNGATWRCDTIEVWLKGREFAPETVASLMHQKYGQFFANGSHLIITGGEPLLQQNQIKEMLQIYLNRFGNISYIEIETNGTLYPDPELSDLIDLYNVSPKLANSGMPKNRRYKHEVLQEFASLSREEDKAILKFVISGEEDMMEVATMVDAIGFPTSEVWLMPACSLQSEFQSKSEMVVSLVKKYGFSYSPRLQVAIYDQTTGV